MVNGSWIHNEYDIKYNKIGDLLNNEYTIVVPNNDVLACVCGTNDSNLKLIEENLGIPVYTKGNEISINNNDSYLCQKFQFIIDRIIDEINNS